MRTAEVSLLAFLLILNLKKRYVPQNSFLRGVH